MAGRGSVFPRNGKWSWDYQRITGGVFRTRELAEDGYSGVEVRVTPLKTEIIIRATRTQSVLGERRATARLAVAALICIYKNNLFFSGRC